MIQYDIIKLYIALAGEIIAARRERNRVRKKGSMSIVCYTEDRKIV